MTRWAHSCRAGRPEAERSAVIAVRVNSRPSGYVWKLCPTDRQCVRGVNFFLVVRSQERGYWVGPVRPQGDTYVQLVIEKYAGLSTAELRPDLR
jgi:hypothetical protein